MVNNVSDPDRLEMDKILYRGNMSASVKELILLVEQSSEILFKYGLNP